MATKKSTRKAASGRGSPEAVEKRRAARQLNSLLLGTSKSSMELDGRTEKRRQRLIQELKEGRGGEPLKPIDRLSHVNELMGIGETLSSLRKQGIKPAKAALNEEVIATAERVQAANPEVRPAAWKILGIEMTEDGQVVRAAGERPTRGRGKSRGRGRRKS
jgi:hypothetical protein